MLRACPVVAIAVAFETLLTDMHLRDVAERIERRLGICLKGVPGATAYERAVLSLCHARGEIAHSGSLGQQAKIVPAQAAFVRCFHMLISRLEGSIPVTNKPIRDLLQDV